MIQLSPGGKETGGQDPNTKIGQHILVDQEILHDITELVPRDSLCVEIGPGFGALTQKLLENGNKVIAYEIDKHTKPALDALSATGDLTVHWMNFLKVPEHDINQYDEFHIVGNIPFHISEPLIAKMVDLQFQSAVLLVGERFAKSLTAQDPGRADWRRVSMIAQAYFDTEQRMTVPRAAFLPPPRVDSAVIRQVRKEYGGTAWQSDPLVLSYRAIVDANASNSTIAKALKGIMVDGQGKIDSGSGDHVLDNRRQRRAGRVALKDYATQYNLGGKIETSAGRSAPSAPQSMYDIVRQSIDEAILSKPMSGLNNRDLRKVCAVIGGVINRRTRR